MPKVTIDVNDYERFELKSAPADPNDPEDEAGYVELRPLPYGMKLTRSDRALKMSMRQEGPQDHKVKGEARTIDLETAQEWTAHFDFAYCIGRHNLMGEKGVLLDFSDPKSMRLLNPKVGTELSELIDALNQDEDEESAEDLVRHAFGSSDDRKVASTDLSTPLDPERSDTLIAGR